ncbi:MAG TPA: hypothetical protein VH599_14330 [Ktedonobacterales bacterium]
MGSNQPGRASEVSVQQLSRQVQMAVTEALRTLDTAKAVDPAGQEEVESLRSVVWSDLTGLEAEFDREEGPRSELLERFFSHLLSSGDHIGQIEGLAGALLGGAPPPSKPEPDSPVAGLFRLHSALASIRRQWQEIASSAPSQPAPAKAAPAVASTPVAMPPRREAARPERNDFFDEMGLPPPKQEMAVDPPGRGRAPVERPSAPPARQRVADRLLDELGLGSLNGPGRMSDGEAPRPRVVVSFVMVFVILGIMAGGVIYLGLSSSPQESSGIEPSAIPTFSLTLPTITPQPTATLSADPPQLRVTGNPLIVPCPGKGSSGFILKNVGGKTLAWSARVNPVGNSAKPVSLDHSNGSLFGPPNSGTDEVTVKVTASVGNIDGTITITTNASGKDGTAQIAYHIHGC